MDEAPEPTPIYEYLTPEESRDTEDGTVYGGWLVAVDPNAAEKPIYDYQLVLCPAKGGDKFSVFQCRTDLLLPEDAAMVTGESIGQTIFDGYQYNLLYGQLVAESQITSVDPDRYFSLPPEMCGQTIPESECADEEIWQMVCGSLAVQQGQVSNESGHGILDQISERVSSLWR